MTNEQAIKDIKENVQPFVGGISLEMAIKALEEVELYRNLDKTNFSDGYNRAVDEFAEAVRQAYASMRSVSDVERATANTIVMGIAEKMKGGE